MKAHPGYSGTIMTATFQISRDIGWGYFEKLAQQRIMQVQSSADPPKKLAPASAPSWPTATSTTSSSSRSAASRSRVVYPTEGTPLIIGPSGVMKDAPNPNAARLLQHYMFSQECQQLMVDCRRPALLPRAGEGQAGPHAAERPSS